MLFVMVFVTALAACSLLPTAAKLDGFLAEPKTRSGYGVVVLHAWWGLNADVKNFCKRLANAGFVAYAPDLFHGKIAATEEAAEELVNEFDGKHAQVEADIATASSYLAERTRKKGKGRIGIVGFSFGAYYALNASNADPEHVRAVVVYYGTGQEEFGHSRASYLGHFAEKDAFEPKKNVDALSKMLKDAGRPHRFFTYSGTGHWFVEPSVKRAYDAAAAKQSWARTVAFLNKELSAE
jgi:carboxymethylenebutenolidase